MENVSLCKKSKMYFGVRKMRNGNAVVLREMKMILTKIRLDISRMVKKKRTRDKLKWKQKVVEGLWKRNLEKSVLCMVKWLRLE